MLAISEAGRSLAKVGGGVYGCEKAEKSVEHHLRSLGMNKRKEIG